MVTAVDAVGNVADAVVTTWLLDRAAPAHTATVSTDRCGAVSNITACNSTTAVTVRVACTPPPSSSTVVSAPCALQWRLTLLRRASTASALCAASGDDGAVPASNATATWQPVDSGGVVVTLTNVDGEYQLDTRAVDAAGNVGAVQSFVWWLDRSVPGTPTVVTAPNPVQFTASVTVDVKLDSDASAGQVQWKTHVGSPETLVSAPNLYNVGVVEC